MGLLVLESLFTYSVNRVVTVVPVNQLALIDSLPSVMQHWAIVVKLLDEVNMA